MAAAPPPLTLVKDDLLLVLAQLQQLQGALQLLFLFKQFFVEFADLCLQFSRLKRRGFRKKKKTQRIETSGHIRRTAKPYKKHSTFQTKVFEEKLEATCCRPDGGLRTAGGTANQGSPGCTQAH